MSKTAVDWTDYSLNPGIYGCTEVSPACKNCYAAGMAHRLVAMGAYPGGITEKRSSGVHWSGKVIVDYDRIGPAFAKLPKKKPARVFVTSMSDLFHEGVPYGFIDRVFQAMVERPHLTFQVLTKRPDQMREWWRSRRDEPNLIPPGGWRGILWPENVWAGCTVEDQKRADERIPHLLQVPAKVRFLSVEPLLGPVLLRRGCDYNWLNPVRMSESAPVPAHIHWVIAGGESGSRARPSNPEWFRSLRDQCAEAGVAFFFKQWGEWIGSEDAEKTGWAGYHEQFPEDGGAPREVWPSTDPRFRTGTIFSPVSYRLGRKLDPKTLDGVEHREFPD